MCILNIHSHDITSKYLRMELENIILSKATQTQKENYHMYSLISGF